MTISIPRTQSLFTHRSQRGFSLMEIIIAIALLVAIMALLLTNLDGVLGRGQEQTARIFVTQTIRTPLLSYRTDVGSYPTTEQGLSALLSAPEGVENWRGPYIDTLPNDPWGNAYLYRSPGERNPATYDVWSLGPDRTDSENNIGNWQN